MPVPGSSTVAVDRATMDRVRKLAKANGVTTFELTNCLLQYAMDHGNIEVPVRTVVIAASADAAKKMDQVTAPIRRRNRPRK